MYLGRQCVRATLPANGVPDTTRDEHGLTRDGTGAVVGWRLWSTAHGGRLRGPARGETWSPAVHTARCQADVPANGNAHGRSPSPGCGCGLYAFTSFTEALTHWARKPECVVGAVRGWGRVMAHDRGWRAERAQPLVVFTPHAVTTDHRRAIGAAYGVELSSVQLTRET